MKKNWFLKGNKWYQLTPNSFLGWACVVVYITFIIYILYDGFFSYISIVSSLASVFFRVIILTFVFLVFVFSKIYGNNKKTPK